MQVKFEGRLAFPQLFEPKAQKNDDGTTRLIYQATLLIAPDSPAAAAIKAAQRQVAAETWGAAKADEVLQALANKDRVCLHDGAEKALKYEGFSGMLYVSANSKVRPAIVHSHELEMGPDGKPVIGPNGKPRLRAVKEHEGLIFAGCYVIAIIDVYGQKDHPKGGNRINAQLAGIQYVREGDAFGGGRASDASDFDVVAVAPGVNGATSPWPGKTVSAGSDLV